MAGSFSNRPKVTETAAGQPIIYPNENAPGAADDIPVPTYPDQTIPGPAHREAPNSIEQVTTNTLKEPFDAQQRVEQIRNDTNTGEKEFSVGYYDIDEAFGYFIQNVIQPTVLENGEMIKVPMLYGSPERWSAMQTFGYYRDNKSKLILPLIMYRRTNISRNEAILFPRVQQLYYITAKKWDLKDRYDNFYTRNPGSVTNKYALTSLPNYVVITYEGIIWTSFVEQMNKIVEKFQFTDNSFWGDPDKFKFRAQIDSFDTATELATDTERMVRATFNMTIYGYILTDSFKNTLTTRTQIGPKKVIFNEDI